MKIGQGDQVKGLVSILGFACLAWASGPELERAHKLYNLTEFQRSLAVLQAIPNKDAAVYELMGRNYYGQGEFKKSTEVLEKAVGLQPGNSDFHLWLGRAYGRRAETSSMVTAPGLASKARQCFEKAVQLSPDNLEAQSDLLEYYLEAPGFLGGGFDKASATAAQIARINPAEGHWAQAKLAEKRKEFSKAEAQLQRAVEMAPHQVGRLIDLAHLLAKQGRYQDAERSLAKAEQIAPNSPKLMFARASLYIKSKRNLHVARELLERYLGSTLTPEDPPRADAEKLLKQVQGS
ncbi:MAG: tetratricopeptide repeat protein [Candidatus Solibacter sp.]|nr:tetratricopeptide repeat protein [Candidatus Solibacter sp.]